MAACLLTVVFMSGAIVSFVPCHLAGPCDNLKDVAFKILQSGVAIVPVIHLSSEDGSFPQLLHLASLSGILKCLCRYFKHCSGSLPILQLPIYAIPLGTWVPRIGESSGRPFAMLRPTASLSSALNMLVQGMLLVCSTLLQKALQLGQDSNIPYETRSQRCQMCLRTDTLLKVMEQLANTGEVFLLWIPISCGHHSLHPMFQRGCSEETAMLHSEFVEADSNRVEGIVSLTDVFRFLLD
ncbi:sucrose nonfermenting 4-like protein-like isoform X1 [Hibiscus syriacus]|uniref:Sucrose nonfermenting 4-like protein-like isoform X1 n=1 Tax=Hibiscus syriacus TaxID=106335 RepID=A0A6A2WXE9_HIBSY|nr:sucrose nonfermenting 4-like protein-like isoform X1 [Hibiscus syriacus]